MKHNRKLRALLPAMALLLTLDITVSLGMLSNADTLDLMFGRGNQTAVGNAVAAEADYYAQEYESAQESLAAATLLARQISDEGIVLLKNDGLLPLNRQSALSPFGLRCFSPYYGGLGSSLISTEEEDVISPLEGLAQAFANLNEPLVQRQTEALAQGAPEENTAVRCSAPVESAAGAACALYEFDASLYEGLEETCAGTIAIVYIGRQTGENLDAWPGAYDDGAAHMLALTSAERALLEYAKAYCDGVVVAICSASAMELAALEDDPGINAVLWLGGAGSTGYASLADILCGAVTPSGRTSVTFAANFQNDPTFANHDDGSWRFVYENVNTAYIGSTELIESVPTAFQEIEEGVYLGYRYYETAWELGALQDYYGREYGVVYPFGYGLSYTTFSQEIESVRAQGRQVYVTVRVRNTGDEHAGKEVVQLYASAPYTDLDVSYAIEKPAAVLVAFAKTSLLEPGGEEVLTLSFAVEDLASYCYTRANGDGTSGCYMLEAGQYALTLRANAHEVLDRAYFHQGSTIWFDNDLPRSSEQTAQATLGADGEPVAFTGDTSGVQAATNQFEALNAYMTSDAVSGAAILSRADWENTQPTAPTAGDRQASDPVIELLTRAVAASFDAQSDPLLGDTITSIVYSGKAPVSGAENGLVLADLRGKYYDDPMWEQLLDQLLYNPDALRRCLFEAAYQTGALEEIGKPASVEHDGPQGLTLADVAGKNWLSGVCGYPAVPVMAATWNAPLMYEFGYMVGQEALLAGIDGWYAPALNILRSPFCGRASEYYGEDPLHAGLLGAQVVSGAGDAGLSCAVKHFALMLTEAHKNPNTCVWMTEQALREIYLRPFEIVVKTARKTIEYAQDDQGSVLVTRTMRAGDFIMAGDSAIGGEWCAANSALLSHVLRGEWAFEGMVISDMHTQVSMAVAQKMLRAGCDALMSNGASGVRVQELASATDLCCLRRAVKNICYRLVNSNRMQGVPPATSFQNGMSGWKAALIVCNAIVFILLAAAILAIAHKPRGLRRNFHKRLHIGESTAQATGKQSRNTPDKDPFEEG